MEGHRDAQPRSRVRLLDEPLHRTRRERGAVRGCEHPTHAGRARGPGSAMGAPGGHHRRSSGEQSSHLFTGTTDATMTQGEAWHFSRLGRMLERADKTSRILDVKYFLLLHSAEEVGTPFDDIQWVAVLRSASAFEMYRQRHGRISPRGVVDFLMLDREFPRAIRFCLLAARDSLHAISGTPLGTFRYVPEKLLGQLGSDLSFAAIDEVIERGL